MAYGTGPYGLGTPPEEHITTPAPLPSSRQIDFKTGRYVLTANGDFAGMPDLHQRVVLLLAYGVVEPDLIGPSFEANLEAQIRNALKPLTESKPPAAIIKRVEVSSVPGNSYRLVEFIDGSVVKVPQ